MSTSVSWHIIEHTWLCRWASNYMKKKLTGTGGPALVSAYNVMTQVLSSSCQGNQRLSLANQTLPLRLLRGLRSTMYPSTVLEFLGFCSGVSLHAYPG